MYWACLYVLGLCFERDELTVVKGEQRPPPVNVGEAGG